MCSKPLRVTVYITLCFAQRLLNYYSNYSTRRLYFGEVETPYYDRQFMKITTENTDHKTS